MVSQILKEQLLRLTILAGGSIRNHVSKIIVIFVTCKVYCRSCVTEYSHLFYCRRLRPLISLHGVLSVSPKKTCACFEDRIRQFIVTSCSASVSCVSYSSWTFLVLQPTTLKYSNDSTRWNKATESHAIEIGMEDEFFSLGPKTVW